MPTPPPVEYADALPQVRAVFDDIKKTRNVPDVNNFWKYLAHDPKTLKRTWESVKEVMAPGMWPCRSPMAAPIALRPTRKPPAGPG